MWSDTNRYNQTNYSGPTIFPVESNYTNPAAFEQDYKRAQRREENHQEFMNDLRLEAQEEAYYEEYGDAY